MNSQTVRENRKKRKMLMNIHGWGGVKVIYSIIDISTLKYMTFIPPRQ